MGEAIITKTIKVEHSDGWGYKITGYGDTIEIVYYETDFSDKKNVRLDKRTFTLDPYLYKDVCKAILDVANFDGDIT